MHVLKFLTFSMIGLVTLCTFFVWKTGRRNKRGVLYSIAIHRLLVGALMIVSVICVSLIEATVRTTPDPYHYVNATLFHFHLGVVVLLAIVFFSMMFRFSGIRARLWHSRLAYGSFYPLFATALSTGIIMLVQLP